MSLAQRSPCFVFDDALEAQPGRRLAACYTFGGRLDVARHQSDRVAGFDWLAGANRHVSYQNLRGAAKVVYVADLNAGPEHLSDSRLRWELVTVPAVPGEHAEVTATFEPYCPQVMVEAPKGFGAFHLHVDPEVLAPFVLDTQVIKIRVADAPSVSFLHNSLSSSAGRQVAGHTSHIEFIAAVQARTGPADYYLSHRPASHSPRVVRFGCHCVVG